MGYFELGNCAKRGSWFGLCSGILDWLLLILLPQGSVLGPFLFLAYVNDIWRNIEPTIRLFADNCEIYRKIINKEDIEKLQKDLDRLGEWAVENAMKINLSKSKQFASREPG